MKKNHKVKKWTCWTALNKLSIQLKIKYQREVLIRFRNIFASKYDLGLTSLLCKMLNQVTKKWMDKVQKDDLHNRRYN